MDEQDPIAVGKQAVRLGLLSEHQLVEAVDEVGGADLGELLRYLERKGWLTPWQSGKLLKGDEDGYFLGGYRLLYKVASGSFGRVYRAEEARGGRVVAVKVLRRRWSEDQQRIDLFIREGRVGQSLKHPSIVEVLTMSQDPASRQYYIVMEFVEGGNLREILAIRKTLTVAESLRILEDCASALAYAYARGLTHRDVKLTNILISSQGAAKLVDFGLAQFFATLAKGDKEKVDRTVDYAGLERATNVKLGDVRSDIFFLGCVFHEMLTGRPPITMGRDRHERMNKRRFDEIQPLRRGDIAAPPSVYQLAETMMALSPAQRYQTPAQLLDAIKAARREVEGKAAGGPAAASRSVFIVERNERLQETLRDKFKALGFRVFLAGDPASALDRYRQQPFDALIVNAGTTGEDGRIVFQQVLTEAGRKQFPCAGILLLSKDQGDWAGRVQSGNTAVLVEPVSFKQLKRTLQDLLA